jgi:uncharacterized protein with von Willebrand factor type A (vWA) domain
VPRLLPNLLRFGAVLRRAGIDVHPGRLIDVVRALDLVNLAARDEVYHACRTLLVHRYEQLELFDRAFAEFWRAQSADANGDGSPAAGPDAAAIEVEAVVVSGEDARSDRASDEAVATPPSERGVKVWSDVGGLASKDFATLTADELDAARIALSRLTWTPGERRTRRWIRGRGPRLDLRRAIADSRRTGGDIVSIVRRTRRVRPRPMVLLCDISGSMERYSRMLLHFAHLLAWRQRRVEAFLFATHLTRITRQLRMPRADAALAAVSESVRDWSGGTRIGGALKEFHQHWGRRALNGGAVVLLISDGWDRGDPAELAEQIARLQRSCYRLVWLNPLIGSIDYAPLTRGLQAALPFVDDFLPARTLANLADLAVHLNALV